MSILTERMILRVDELNKKNLYRKRNIKSNQQLISFSSNDYLSLGTCMEVREAYLYGFANYPPGSGASMVVTGFHIAHHDLEEAFKKALGVESCLLFGSGYTANLSVMNLLAAVGAHVLMDKAVHASIYDGINLSKVAYERYAHNDLSNLVDKIKIAPQNTIVLTESIFSMSGKQADLARIAQISAFPLLVDEAHAFGILGENGKGAVQKYGLSINEVPLRIIPFGKAMAGMGAIVAGSKVWIDALLQSARPLIYSTALSPAYAYGLKETLQQLIKVDDRRKKLMDLIAYFRKCVAKSASTWADSLSQIQQLKLGCSVKALSFAQKLEEKGIICLPMRQPTVSKSDTGLRVILNYQHEMEHIDILFKEINSCI